MDLSQPAGSEELQRTPGRMQRDEKLAQRENRRGLASRVTLQPDARLISGAKSQTATRPSGQPIICQPAGLAQTNST
jgi:hypothetical protein